MRALFLVLWVGAAAWTCTASAQSATQPPTEYMRALIEGRERLLDGDPQQALQPLSEAVRLDPSEAAAFYYIAVAQRALAHPDRAIQSFETTTRLARQQGDARMQARGLYGTAATLEQAGRLDAARRAWNAYARFADAHLDLAYPDVARERVRMITVAQEAQRIAREARSRANGDGDGHD